MSRTDYYFTPEAPKPTSIVIAASAFVLDEAGRLLMIRRTDSGLYALPGGTHELGASLVAQIAHPRGGEGHRNGVEHDLVQPGEPLPAVGFLDGPGRPRLALEHLTQ